MKIVHVVYSLEVGGAEVLVSQLCRLQRAQGHDVQVVAYAQLGSVGEALAAEGVPVHIPGEANPVLTAWRNFLLFRRLRPDVVHTHNPAPTLQAAASARLAGVPAVIATRHSLVAPPLNLAEERNFNLVARCCDWIVGICEITCDNLRRVPGAHTDKIVRVYNGAAPLTREQPASLARPGFTLLFVGRVVGIKNLETLLRATALAAPQVPDLRLWIVGDGSSRGELEALAQELGIAELVRFWGQQMDTARFFSAADAFAMSSTSEGLPMSLLQAMSLGLPAITTDVGGMAEVVRLSGGGLLVPVGDAAAMAEQIVRLAAAPKLREELGTRGREAYEREFTLGQMEAGYAALYRRRRRA